MELNKRFYVYAYLDPHKRGCFIYGNLLFRHEPFYIGKGCRERAWSNQSSRLTLNKIKSIKNLGQEPLVVIVKKNITEDQAFNIEKELISKIGRKDIKTGILTNQTDGGEGPSKRNVSFTTRLKISKGLKDTYRKEGSKLKGTHLTEKHKEKLSIGKLGSKNPMYNKSISEETKLKRSLCRKGKPSPLKGRNLTEEHKRKISESALLGKNKTKLKGRKLTEEHKKHISESTLGKKKLKRRIIKCGF